MQRLETRGRGMDRRSSPAAWLLISSRSGLRFGFRSLARNCRHLISLTLGRVSGDAPTHDPRCLMRFAVLIAPTSMLNKVNFARKESAAVILNTSDWSCNAICARGYLNLMSVYEPKACAFFYSLVFFICFNTYFTIFEL